MNTYAKIANQDYNKGNFDVKEGHIESIKIIWGRDDVIGMAKNMNVTLTDDEVDEILYVLVSKHDAEQGLTWITIEFWIEEIVRERIK